MSSDQSLQLHSTQFTPFRNKRTKELINREDTLNLSTILSETSIYRHLNDTSLRHVLDESSTQVPAAGAGRTGETLSEAFFEVMQSSRPADVLDTLGRLARTCCDSLELVEPWNRYNAHNYWLAEEANTWKLLHCLYADSVTDHPDSIDSLLTEPTLSQQTLVRALFQCDSELRLLQVLVDWLEATAAYQEEATKTSAPVIGNNIHWGNTLHQLLIGTSLFNKEKNAAMISCMDPDAPLRQNKTIHSDDQQDDHDLCKRIFTQIRCGKFKEAISQCISAGQAWRGAVLQGWRLLHYLRREGTQLEITGNPSRDLWKWCCMGIANNVSENVHYRATVGILCGHLPSTLLACQGSWEDLLWAHLRVQIEGRVDRFLREHHTTAEANTTPTDVLELLQSELQTEDLSLQQVFSNVSALMEGRKESYYQSCQRHLMLGHVRAIMQDSLQWIDCAEESFIRFLAHMILILRQMGKDPQHDIGDKILEKYIAQLIDRIDGSVECPELIAFYTSTVPTDQQVYLFSELLDRVHKSEYRQGVVRAGASAGVDVAAAARVAIRRAIGQIQQDYTGATFTPPGPVERDSSPVSKVISSLEWLSLVPGQLQEALWLSNAMIRTFIFIGNTDGAAACVRSVSDMFPSFVSEVPSDCCELREHLCLKAYLEALESFATWYRHSISGQPREVDPLPADASFTDKVHHEQRCAQVKVQRERWASATSHQARRARDTLYNVLLFPGGWLQDEPDGTSSPAFTADERSERAVELDALRRLAIPEAVVLILRILQSGRDVEQHREAVRLSELLAAENRALYRVFTPQRLGEVLDRINESALVLLEHGVDMFGHTLTDD